MTPSPGLTGSKGKVLGGAVDLLGSRGERGSQGQAVMLPGDQLPDRVSTRRAVGQVTTPGGEAACYINHVTTGGATGWQSPGHPRPRPAHLG